MMMVSATWRLFERLCAPPPPPCCSYFVSKRCCMTKPGTADGSHLVTQNPLALALGHISHVSGGGRFPKSTIPRKASREALPAGD